MGQKKFFSSLLIAAVLALSFVGALAVVPHVHGKDFSHESHQGCPVYQFGLHSVDFASALSTTLIVLLAFFIFRFSFKFFFYTSPITGRSSRAPPASF